MIASSDELIAVLRQYNPWWTPGGRIQDLPPWRRAAFREIGKWIDDPPGNRALLLSGARQIGKTTLFLQTIDDLLSRGTPPNNILYATFDHPLLKLVGLDALVRIWREYEPAQDSPEFLFLDEIQVAKDWQTWLKHQADFDKRRRIAVTGSATPLITEGQESGVGRWQTLKLATLSFFEYLQLRGGAIPGLPPVRTLLELFEWQPAEFSRVASAAQHLTGLFHEYLIRGGFPQTALLDSIPLAQKLLREDIVDKVLKRDMTALFGVRRVLELEQVFLYLCLHDGGLLDLPRLCEGLQLKRPTVSSFIDLLELTHLIYRLMPFGYGKQVLRGRTKVYLADPAIAPSVLLKGKSLLEDATALGHAVEAAFFKHVYARYYASSIRFSYWHGKKDREVDFIAELGSRIIPFEVKYRNKVSIDDPAELRGMLEFCGAQKIDQAYVITREWSDFGVRTAPTKHGETRLLFVPAPLACFWLGESELQSAGSGENRSLAANTAAELSP